MAIEWTPHTDSLDKLAATVKAELDAIGVKCGAVFVPLGVIKAIVVAMTNLLSQHVDTLTISGYYDENPRLQEKLKDDTLTFLKSRIGQNTPIKVILLSQKTV